MELMRAPTETEQRLRERRRAVLRQAASRQDAEVGSKVDTTGFVDTAELLSRNSSACVMTRLRCYKIVSTNRIEYGIIQHGSAAHILLQTILS